MDRIDLDSDEAICDEIDWRGCSMNEIYRNLNEYELRHVVPVHPSESHAVLYHFPIRNANEPPRPLRQHERWDSSHVRLSCASQSQYPVAKSDGTTAIESRWELIQSAFVEPIQNSHQLETAILSYNSKYKRIWKFKALHKLFDEESTEEEEKAFFECLLPKIIALALRLPELVMAPIPLLKQGQNRSVTLSQQQISCLLANAFLCTFPRRNTLKKQSEYSTFPDINFSRLFQSTGPQVMEKIKCICHYFRRVCGTDPLGVATFIRRSISEKELPKWQDCTAPLGITPLHVSSAGTIEDQGKGLLQVDFANKFLGGGVLGSGCVQEEIRFVICPELLVSKLFTEALKPTEALIMVGCEQFSKYTGYASTFTWAGDYKDPTPMDESRRRQCNIVAIDALHFVQSSHQFREEWILRELNKAYVGFLHPLDTPAPGIASGNWGCGAFGGEASLKALIQLMACTLTKRPLVYFTFGDIELRDAIHDIHTFFIENDVTVNQLWSYLKEFRSHKLPPSDLYGFICQLHCDKQKNTTDKANSRGKWSTFVFHRKAVARVEQTIRKSEEMSRSKKNNNKDDAGRSVLANVDEVVVEETDTEEDCIEEKPQEDVRRDLFSPESFLDKKIHVEETQASVVKSPTASSSERTRSESADEKPKPNFIQRTLLEMLDFDYKKKGMATAAKKPRH